MFVCVKVKQMFESESETNDGVRVRQAFLSVTVKQMIVYMKEGHVSVCDGVIGIRYNPIMSMCS